jgi:membrane protein EpsK
VGIGLWLIPYLVHHLGRAAYGLIPIAGIMTQYVSIISQSVSSAVSRFLTVALQRNDTEEANRLFNTAICSYSALALLQVPVFGLIIWQANHLFNIPNELYVDALILLTCSAGAFLMNLVSSVFAVPIYANNRLDISRAMNVLRQIARLVGIVGLFLIFRPGLRYVGYVDLALGLAECVATVAIGKRLAPSLRVDRHAFDWRKVRQLTTMGGWLVINYLGFLLFLRMDIWVCNRFIGAEAAGDYAALLTWSNLIRHGGRLFAGLISPMVLIYYARSEEDRLIRLVQVSVRLLCLLLAVPISILCVFSSSILKLWLGESFVRLAPLMVVMLCHLTISVGITPLFSMRVALNKVKVPALMGVVVGIANVFLAIFSVKYLSWGTYGVAIAGAVTLTFLNVCWNPVYVARVLHKPWHTFVRPGVSAVLASLLLSLIGLGIKYVVHPTSWAQLSAACMITALIGAIGVWLMLPAEDRRLFADLLPGNARSRLSLLRRRFC